MDVLSWTEYPRLDGNAKVASLLAGAMMASPRPDAEKLVALCKAAGVAARGEAREVADELEPIIRSLVERLVLAGDVGSPRPALVEGGNPRISPRL